MRVNPLDGIRGLAVLLVIVGHAAHPQSQPLAAAGVTLFFVLSGYLITGILLRDADETGRPQDLRRFYGRRARRLLPALTLLLAFEIAFRIVSGRSLLPVLYAGTYSTNVAIAWNETSSLSHTWSLALEEQFYLLWPLALPVVLRSRRPLALIAGVAVASAALRTVLYFGFPPLWLFAYFGPFTRIDAILAGCGLAIFLHRSTVRTNRVASPVAVGGLAVIGLSAVWSSGPAAVLLLPLLVVASTAVVWAPRHSRTELDQPTLRCSTPSVAGPHLLRHVPLASPGLHRDGRFGGAVLPPSGRDRRHRVNVVVAHRAPAAPAGRCGASTARDGTGREPYCSGSCTDILDNVATGSWRHSRRARGS